jgi:phosphotransferase system  glucose/maltose/N-acetylglucosamine-specific IIC component
VWPFLWELVVRAWNLFVSAVGTTTLGFVVGLVVLPIVIHLVKVWRGTAVMKLGSFGETAVGVIAVYGVIYLAILIFGMPRKINEMFTRNSAANFRFQPPTPPLDWNAARSASRRPPYQRRLSKAQHKMLADLLRKTGRYETAIRHSQGNMESQIYANDFESAIKDAGWIVNPHPVFLIQERETTGLWIIVSDVNHAPNCAAILQQSLKAIGLKALGMPIPGLGQNPAAMCELFVGLSGHN